MAYHCLVADLGSGVDHRAGPDDRALADERAGAGARVDTPDGITALGLADQRALLDADLSPQHGAPAGHGESADLAAGADLDRPCSYLGLWSGSLTTQV
jgi:hypothetical protein